ncbi:hypothetical protein [Methanosphaera sp. BMS]|uniref:hypothetical protein n=1 Tax=Methanosphaera sp. BMS TaxID=1789762 RepID=UPI000DC1E013|nr:hypothetical protein [Methanosphaera sp. BMS]AWX32294.1 hypothetical protein AW729_03870 [Methanosphaera sp. BMS]
MNFNEEIYSKIMINELFDEEYYVQQFSDFNSELKPLNHYLQIGYLEGKNPSKKFSTYAYLENYHDVKLTGINPLIHYVLFGKKENREIFPAKSIESRVMNQRIFNEKLLKNDSYYKNRWEYFNEVIEHVIQMDDVEKILELGPYKSPLVRGEDVMDISDKFTKYYPYEIGKFIAHDCSKVPYPVKDKEYDLIIACQVLEHFGLRGQQVKIFNEFERMSKRAIITLPYKWFRPQNRDHHMIDERVIDFWASDRDYSFEKITGTRILRIYDFD